MNWNNKTHKDNVHKSSLDIFKSFSNEPDKMQTEFNQPNIIYHQGKRDIAMKSERNTTDCVQYVRCDCVTS